MLPHDNKTVRFGQDIFHKYGLECTHMNIRIFFLKSIITLLGNWFGGRKNYHNCWYMVKLFKHWYYLESKGLLMTPLKCPEKWKTWHNDVRAAGLLSPPNISLSPVMQQAQERPRSRSFHCSYKVIVRYIFMVTRR